MREKISNLTCYSTCRSKAKKKRSYIVLTGSLVAILERVLLSNPLLLGTSELGLKFRHAAIQFSR